MLYGSNINILKLVCRSSFRSLEQCIEDHHWRISAMSQVAIFITIQLSIVSTTALSPCETYITWKTLSLSFRQARAKAMSIHGRKVKWWQLLIWQVTFWGKFVCWHGVACMHACSAQCVMRVRLCRMFSREVYKDDVLPPQKGFPHRSMEGSFSHLPLIDGLPFSNLIVSWDFLLEFWSCHGTSF